MKMLDHSQHVTFLDKAIGITVSVIISFHEFYSEWMHYIHSWSTFLVELFKTMLIAGICTIVTGILAFMTRKACNFLYDRYIAKRKSSRSELKEDEDLDDDSRENLSI